MGEFDFDAPEVQEDLYDDNIESMPVISWHGKVAGDQKWGFFASSRDSFEQCPVGWDEHEIRFGLNPNAPLSPVYFTYRLRACPIAVRKRWVVDAHDGRTYFYPWYTRKEDRVEGKMTGQIQVMIRMPDDNVLRMLALRGFTKNVAWSNDPNRRGLSEFPTGVEQVLGSYAESATQNLRESKGYEGPPMPTACAWWLDLIPWIDKENGAKKAALVDVGHGIWMNPFVADMTVGKFQGHPELSTRFVGKELFNVHQAIRADVGVPWVNEWGEITEAESRDDDDWTEPIGDDEDDEIPF